jgi:nucleoside-diphosphate-sugar epimerase
MRVLVTGHLGYIGTVLTPALLARGHEVVGMDSDLYERSTFGPADAIAPVRSIRRDIRDAHRSDFEGFDAVLHLAGLSNDPLGDLDASLTDDINHKATVRLGELAKAAGVSRFVFSSSCSTYGAAGDDILTEAAAFNPVTPYGQSKVDAEIGLAALASDAFSPVFLRNATAYGLSPRLRFDLVVNNLTAWAHCTGEVHLKSDGSPWRPIVHVADISRAFIAALEAPREAVHAAAFNICATPENYRVRQIAEIVRDEVEGSQVGFAEGASPDARNYRVSGDLWSRAFPHAVPTRTCRDGVRELRDAYRRIGVTLAEFEGQRYRRVDHIKMLIREGVLDTTLRRTAPARRATA